jgi:hypothetical protein
VVVHRLVGKLFVLIVGRRRSDGLHLKVFFNPIVAQVKSVDRCSARF